MKKLNKKVIATLLVVSQILTSAGMATFAATFTKISGDSLSSTTESDDLYTRYYEEFLYESKTYLYNDSGDSVGESDDSVGESDDSVGASTRPSELLSSESEESATKSPWGTSPEDETETTTVKASDDSVGASSTSPEIEEEETTDIYDEEPEEDPEYYPEEPEEDETTIEETDETTIDEAESESNVEESETDDEARETRSYDDEESGARETRPYDDEESGARETRPYDETTEDGGASETTVESSEDSVGASTRPSELLSSESEESATKSPWGTSPEETTIADPELATFSEIEETEEESSEALLELVSIVATESELFNLEPLIASESEPMLFGDLLGATPIGGDGTHVHKICGVAEGAACLHTEVAAHTEIGDYRLIAVDEYEIMAEVIDNLVGRVDDGQGNYEYITEPEYLVLGRDIEFDKSVTGNPRDADTTNDFYSLDIKRD